MRSLLAADRRHAFERRLIRASAWSFSFTMLCVVLYLFAVRTPTGQYTDSFGLGSFDWLPRTAAALLAVLRHVIPCTLVVAALTCSALAVRRRMLADAVVGVSALIVGYTICTILKRIILDRPLYGDFGYTHNTYPSGHVCVSALAAIMIVRMITRAAVRRAIAAIVIVCVFVVGIASVTTIAHRPSDVWGGLAVAGAIAPWGVRLQLPPLRVLTSRSNGPVAAIAALALCIAALAPLAGATVGTAVYFTVATFALTWLLIHVASFLPVTQPPHPSDTRMPAV